MTSADSNGYRTTGFVSVDTFRANCPTAGPVQTGELLINPVALADTTLDFHRSLGALTPKVAAAIATLRRGGANIVRLAHQPNLFPYLNIFAQISYLEHIATAVPELSPIILFVDHDDVSDRRFHTSYNWKGGAHRRIVPYSTKPYLINRRQIMSSVMLDQEAVSKITHAAACHLADVRPDKSVEDWLLTLWPDHLMGRSKVSIVEFQAAPLVRTFSNELGSSVLFCPLSRLVSNLGNSLGFILQKLADFNIRWLDAPPVWSICSACSTRNHLTRTGDIYVAHCAFCKDVNNFRVDDLLCDPVRATLGQIAPKVLLDTLLDYFGLGVLGGSNYLGGLRHLENTLNVLEQMFDWVPQESCWRCMPWSATVIDSELARSIFIRNNISAIRAARMQATGRMGMISLLADKNLLNRVRSAVEREADAAKYDRRLVELQIDKQSPWRDNQTLEDYYRALG